MLHEFLLYLYCSLSGRNQVYSYFIYCKHDWDYVLALFKAESIKEENLASDVFITCSQEEINIEEFYDSDARHRGSDMVLNNEAHTIITMENSNLKVTIEIYRVFESRIITNVFLVLHLLFSTTLIAQLISFVWKDFVDNFSIVLALIFTIAFSGTLALLWILSRQKTKMIKRMIEYTIEK